MGTRADFYVGRGPDAEWLGSVTWDGYPDGFDTHFYEATTEDEYKNLVAGVADERDDWTDANEGWPWPWDDSRTTDYAYTFKDGKVYASSFGHPWFDCSQGNGNPLPLPGQDEDEADDAYFVSPKMDEEFPDMSARRVDRATMMAKSGLIIITPDGVVK